MPRPHRNKAARAGMNGGGDAARLFSAVSIVEQGHDYSLVANEVRRKGRFAGSAGDLVLYGPSDGKLIPVGHVREIAGVEQVVYGLVEGFPDIAYSFSPDTGGILIELHATAYDHIDEIASRERKNLLIYQEVFLCGTALPQPYPVTGPQSAWSHPFRATASATRMPSTAAETMPPA